jgi:hypothetical protein
VAANSVDYDLTTGSFTIADAGSVVHDLTGIMLPPIRLVYDQASDSPIVRVGLLTAQFVIRLPGGQTLTLDPRTAKALDRLGWVIPRV